MRLSPGSLSASIHESAVVVEVKVQGLVVSSSSEEAILRVLMTGAPWKPWADRGVIRIQGRRTEWTAFLKSIAPP